MATISLVDVEEIRELLHIAPPQPFDPFMWETPAWRWKDAENFGTLRGEQNK